MIASTEQTEQSKLDILWSVATNGAEAVQIQAIKTLNEMRFNNQVVEKNEHSEDEVRANIETMINQYWAMPLMVMDGQ